MKNKANTETSMEKSQNIPSYNCEDMLQTQLPSTHIKGTIPFTFQDGGQMGAKACC